MSSFQVLFSSYKNILSQKKIHEAANQASAAQNTADASITASDVQGATKKIFSIATQQNAATLNNLSFYDTLSSHFLQSPSSAASSNNNNNNDQDDKKTASVSASPVAKALGTNQGCTPLLKEIGWDLLTELFLLYSKDTRFSNFLISICHDISPRELSIMFAEVFTHPVLSINATHHHFQLHIMQNNYVLNDEDTEQRKQMMNLNIVNKPMNMDASDDILSFHRNINYLKIQTLFIQCIIILFKRLTAKTSSKYAINHFYQSLIPTAILHFQTLSKELSYQFYLYNVTQYHDHHSHGHAHSHHRRSDSVTALDAFKKQRQEWLANSKKEYELYLQEIYKLFALMVNNHLDLKDIDEDTEIKDAPVDIEEMIKCFQPRKTEDGDAIDNDNEEYEDDEQAKGRKVKQSNNLNTLWLARYGFGVLSGVYWWYNVVYNEDIESDGDVNNDSTEVLHNIKSPAYNIFMTDIVDGLQSQILIKLCHSVGMNGNILLSLRDYLGKLESKLESEKTWHLNTEQLTETNKSNPSTPTPQLKAMSSMGPHDLNPIVEEHEDDMIDIKDVMSASNSAEDAADDDSKNNEQDKVRTAMISLTQKAHEDDEEEADGTVMINGNKEDEFEDEAAGWDDEDDVAEEDKFNEVDEKKLKKMQETQALLDEVKTWNEFMPLVGVTCYYHSLWVLMQSDDCTQNGGKRFRTHSKYFWKCLSLLMEQITTLPAGIEFGEFLLNTTIGKMSNKDLKVECKEDLKRLLNTAQFHEQGLWALVQFLTSQLKGISDRALHQKLWQFIVHVINAADLKTRFQCIVSTALQCPIPVVQSLMFTELKNQIFNNWNVDLGEEKGQETDGNNLPVDANENEEEEMMDEMQQDTLNPFCSRQVVMVLVQRLGKELQNISLQNIYQELDSLNACLNLCRFILGKDKGTNYTQIFDVDCPLRQVLQKLCDEMTRISKENENGEAASQNKNKTKSANSSAGIGAEMEDFQKQMMKNQFLVSLDLVKRILEMYNK